MKKEEKLQENYRVVRYLFFIQGKCEIYIVPLIENFPSFKESDRQSVSYFKLLNFQ